MMKVLISVVFISFLSLNSFVVAEDKNPPKDELEKLEAKKEEKGLWEKVLEFLGAKTTEKAQEQMKQIQSKLKKPEKQEQKPVQENKKEKKPEYVYNGSGKRDPFKPFYVTAKKLEGESAKESKISKVPAGPLTATTYNDFKLVAVIKSKDGYKALIEDKTQKGYIVANGMVIGEEGAVIKSITSDGIILEEEYEDALGKIKKKETKIKLPKEGEGL